MWINIPVSVIESGQSFSDSLIIFLLLCTGTKERCSFFVIISDLLDSGFISIGGLVDVSTFTLLLTLTL